VQEEAAEARKRRVLIPVRIAGDAEPPLGFRAIQAADLRGWDGDPTSPEFRRLVADIAALLGPPPAQPHAAAAAPPAREPRPVGSATGKGERREEHAGAGRGLEDTGAVSQRRRWIAAAVGGGAVTAVTAVAVYLLPRDGPRPNRRLHVDGVEVRVVRVQRNPDQGGTPVHLEYSVTTGSNFVRHDPTRFVRIVAHGEALAPVRPSTPPRDIPPNSQQTFKVEFDLPPGTVPAALRFGEEDHAELRMTAMD
jgi:hypothetical protein